MSVALAAGAATDHIGRMRVRHLVRGLHALLFALGAQAQDGEYRPAPDAETAAKTPSQFARFVQVGEGGHLDTAITTYRNGDGVTVTLIGAVHIADPGHYAGLQELFASYDALLYEMVAPPDHRPKPGETRGNHFVSILQRGLKNGLGLQFQLDALDYSVDNFVHADLDPESFAKLQEEKGESLIGLMLQAMAREMKRLRDGDVKEVPEALKGFDLVSAFRSGEGRHLLRMLFATQLQDLERAAAGFGGEDGSVLLEGRNEKCLEVLQEQIADGVKDLGIYYGAAHMPHMEKRLTEDLGFEKVAHRWIVAWDCEKKSDEEIEAGTKDR